MTTTVSVATDELITIKGVSREFPKANGDNLLVLENVDLTIPSGEIVGLLGRSGSGKSTLLRIIAGLSSPSSGEALYRGRPISSPPKGLAMVFQSFALFPWLTVDQAQQEERFAERREDPLKRWKLSPIDLVAREKYADYGHMRDRMLEVTHTPKAPWTLVDFNDQRLGRLTLIRHLLDHLPDTQVPEHAIDFPPLAGKPAQESFTGPLQPIAPFKLPKSAD